MTATEPKPKAPSDGLPAWTTFERRFLTAAIVVAIAMRVVHWASLARYPWFDFLGLDAKYYDEWAQRILREGLQGKDPYFMGPLYPHFLAVVYWIAGRSLDAVRVVQLGLSAGTVAIVHLLGRRYGGTRLACVASGCVALYGPLVAYSVTIIYPALNVFLTSCTLLLLHEAARRRSRRFALAAGLVLGADALGRGNVLLFAPVAAVWLAAAWGNVRGLARPDWRRLLSAAAPFTAGVALAIAPCTLHNWRTGDPALLTTNGGLNFYIGNGPMASGGHETPVLHVPRPDGTVETIVADLHKDVECRTEAELAAGRPLSYTETSDFWFDETVRTIRANPGAFFSGLLRKAVHFWSAYEVPQIEHFDYFRRYSFALRGPVLAFGGVGSLAIVGMVLAWRRRAGWALPYLFVAVYSISTILFFVLDRYRLPILPGLVLFAGFAALETWDAFRSQRMRRAAACVAGVAATVLLMHANFYGVDEEKGVAQILYRQGIVADAGGDWEEAIRNYRAALELKPEYDKCHLNLGVSLARTGRLDEAIRHVVRAEELNPSYYRAPFNRGLLLEQEGRHEEAGDAYRRSVELEPRYLLGRSALAEMLLLEGRFDDARAEVEAILAYDGRWEGEHNPTARARAARLGAYLNERKRLAEKGLGGCFADAPAFRLAEVARLRGRVDEALARLREYFEAGGSCAEAYRALGTILSERKQLEGAEDAFRRAIAADARLPGARLGLARLTAVRGIGRDAAALLTQEIALDPKAPVPHLELGLVHERLLADTTRAEASFAKFRDLGGDPAQLASRREMPRAASEPR